MFVSPGDRGGRPRLQRSLQSAFTPRFKPPVNESFIWRNQGAATVVTQSNGSLFITAPANAGVSYRIREKPIPAAPYTYTLFVIPNITNIAFMGMGACLVDSAGGGIVSFYALRSNVFGDTRIVEDYLNSATSYNSTNAFFSTYTTGIVGLKIHDNGTNRTLSWSSDGEGFNTLVTQARNSWITPDRIGFFAFSQSASAAASGTVLHEEMK